MLPAEQVQTARDVGLLLTKLLTLVIATIALGSTCVWIISWGVRINRRYLPGRGGLSSQTGKAIATELTARRISAGPYP